MPYTKELRFLQNMFAKCHLQLVRIDPTAPPELLPDAALRRTLGLDDYYERAAGSFLRTLEHHTIYRASDILGGTYLIFLLPEQQGPTLVVAGPYLSMEMPYEQLMERAEYCGIDPQLFPLLEKYFAGIPVLTDESPLFAALESFAELIWGEDDFKMVDLDIDRNAEPVGDFDGDPPDHAETLWLVEEVERRYAHENELLQAVAQGQMHKAELLMAGFKQLPFERRLSDQVRNLKNYCIIMNTLLRKAAEQGGVHPLYLDKISSDFAKRIENLSSVEMVGKLMEEMFRSYCRQVSKNSTGHYSPPVQKAIVHIDVNLGSELNLKLLSELLNINASYLSALFKKETGVTLTEYINQKRMKQAARLLTTTRLQIQTISQYCGISDVNYFSKLFKKYAGKTPNEFRKEVRPGIK